MWLEKKMEGDIVFVREKEGEIVFVRERGREEKRIMVVRRTRMCSS